MPRRVAGGTAIITAATIIRSTTITATTITPGTTITTVTATGIANPGYSPALRARAHTSLLRTYAPPRVRLGSSPEDFAAAHIAAAAASEFVQSASGAGFAAAGAEGRGVRWSLSGGGGRVREQALVGTPSRPDARAGEGATPGWGIIATPLPAWLGPAGSWAPSPLILPADGQRSVSGAPRAWLTSRRPRRPSGYSRTGASPQKTAASALRTQPPTPRPAEPEQSDAEKCQSSGLRHRARNFLTA